MFLFPATIKPENRARDEEAKDSENETESDG